MLEEKEIWKSLPNTQYLVSNLGKVFSKKSNKELVSTESNKGYLCVCLYLDGDKSTRAVHRLVMNISIV